MGAIDFYLLMLQKYTNLKQKILKQKKHPLCLGNVSVDFSANNMIKTGRNGSLYDFFVDYKKIDTSNIVDIHKYLMKKNDIVQNVWIFKNYICFNNDFFSCNAIKCVSMKNQECKIRPEIINIYSD